MQYAKIILLIRDYKSISRMFYRQGVRRGHCWNRQGRSKRNPFPGQDMTR